MIAFGYFATSVFTVGKDSSFNSRAEDVVFDGALKGVSAWATSKTKFIGIRELLITFISPKNLELWMDQRVCAGPPPCLIFPYLKLNYNINFIVCSHSALEIVIDLEITALFLSILHLMFVSVRKMLCQWTKVLYWNAELTAENFCFHSLVPYF